MSVSRKASVTRRAPGPRRLVLRAAALASLGLGATGCTLDEWTRFGFPVPITEQGDRILGLWQGATIAAIAVGLFTLALILGAAFAFRKKSDALPSQVHYNLPIELLYTAVPFVIVSVLFYFTAVDEAQVNRLSEDPDVTVGVVGFQWNWRFDYADHNLAVLGRPGELPQLVLPTNRTIQFVETSPDVIHSWWVPEFIFKRDVIPGRKNKFEVTLKEGTEGVYTGRCAEYCGLYHQRMYFTVQVVSPQEYDRFIASASAAAAAGDDPNFATVGAANKMFESGTGAAAVARAASTTPPVAAVGAGTAASSPSGSTK